MGVFRDEYGDVIVWRIVVAVALLVAAAIIAAVMIFGPRADGEEDEGHVDLPAPTARAADDGLNAWLAGVEGSDLLSDLGEAKLVGLMRATEAWEKAHAAEGARLSVVEVSMDGEAGTTVRLHVERKDDETWVEATLGDGGTWQLSEHPEGFGPAADEHVAMADEGTLAKVMDPAVAAEASRQLLASGIEGADKAWTTPESVATEGSVTRMTIWFPREGAEPEAWDAAYDESFGMLEIQPASQGATPATEPGEVA